MTRKQSTMSFNSSCLRVPLNPYSQQPSPSYERTTPNTEDVGSSARKSRVASGFSRPASSVNSPVSKRSIIQKSIGVKETRAESSNNSPLDSFLDFYESIPDYQDVTHLSDREFADKMKLLRNKHRQYLDNLDGRYSPREFEECEAGNYEKKTHKSVNKLELAKEWLNKSCDSLSSLGRKSENDYQLKTLEMDNQTKRASSANVSPRKYVQYDIKNESETHIMDSGSSLSIDSHILKSKDLTPSFVVDSQNKGESNTSIQDCNSPFPSAGRSESHEGISTLFGVKERSTNNYDFYNLKESIIESHPSTAKKSSHQSCALQSSETSELNVQDSNSHYGLTHHDAMTYEDYYVPCSGWMQSDSDSMMGTMHHIPSTRPPTTVMSQSLPGSPITKRSSNSSKTSSKKKTRRKRRGPQKSVTKPVPFNFVSSDRQYTRSTPDLSSHCRSPSPKHFRARPIPRNLFSNYVYQKKQDDDFFRALKRKVRAEEMLRAASLPPSMEFRERLVRVQAAASLGPGSSSDQSGIAGGGPERASEDADAARRVSSEGRARQGGRGRRGRTRRPPDHPNKCQERDLAVAVAASPSPYSLRAASLSPRRKQGSVSSYSDSRRCRPRSGCTDTMDTSRSNLAALLRIQSARQRLEAEHHRLREEQARRAEMRLKERLTRLTPAWRSIQYSTEEDLALRAAARREEERQRRLEHGVLMRHMLHRVHTIPTLFERQSLSRSPPTAQSPRRAFSPDAGGPQCRPGCPTPTDDEDAADVKVFAPQAALHKGPRQSRPCSADARAWRPQRQGGPDRRGVSAALRSPDRASSRLRTYHRQLPHRVEFSEESARGQGQDEQDGDAPSGARLR